MTSFRRDILSSQASSWQ